MAIVERFGKIVWDGTNGAAVVAQFDASLLSDDGQTLRFDHPNGETYTVHVEQIILFKDFRGINDAWCDWHGAFDPAHFAALYEEI